MPPKSLLVPLISIFCRGAKRDKIPGCQTVTIAVCYSTERGLMAEMSFIAADLQKGVLVGRTRVVWRR